MTHDKPEKVLEIIWDAGGSLTGRTRLQKTAYLLHKAGFTDAFRFRYKHYGPYSEGLAVAAANGVILKLLHEEQHRASWGGLYSDYSAPDMPEDWHECEDRKNRQAFTNIAVKSDPIVLELLATAVFLEEDYGSEAWNQVLRRKPEKATKARMRKAQELLAKLRECPSPEPLPEIA